MNKTISHYHLVVRGPSFVGMSHVTEPSGTAPRRGVSDGGMWERVRLAYLSVLVHHTLGIPTWRDCNALTIKLVPLRDDDHNCGTLGHAWGRDVTCKYPETHRPASMADFEALAGIRQLERKI